MSEMKKGQKLSIQIAMVVIFLVVMTFITILCIPLIKLLQTEEGRLQIKEIVGDMPIISLVVYVALQAVQVVVAIIPGGLMQLLGGTLFGKAMGFVFCLLGTLIGTMAVYFLVKAIGAPLVETLVAKKNLKKLKILEDEKRLEVLVFIMFLIPGIPKDALTYFVPLTKMNANRFFLYSTIARSPAIFMSIVVGDNLSEGNFISSLVIFLIILAIGLVGILYKDKVLDKVKTKKDEIKVEIKTKKDEIKEEIKTKKDELTEEIKNKFKNDKNEK